MMSDFEDNLDDELSFISAGEEMYYIFLDIAHPHRKIEFISDVFKLGVEEACLQYYDSSAKDTDDTDNKSNDIKSVDVATFTDLTYGTSNILHMTSKSGNTVGSILIFSTRKKILEITANYLASQGNILKRVVPSDIRVNGYRYCHEYILLGTTVPITLS